MTVSDDDSIQKTGKQKTTILQASSENLKRLDNWGILQVDLLFVFEE